MKHLENGTNGLLLITFNGVDVQIWSLHSFCSKLIGGSDRRFRFWIRSIFYGQNTWKTEREFGMTLVFSDFFMEKNTVFKNVCNLRPSSISGLQKLRRNHIGRT